MLLDAWNAVSAGYEFTPVLAVSEEGAFPPAFSPALVWHQGDGDLGLRLERILGRGLVNARAALAIGSDVPQLRPEHIRAAVQELDDHDCVLGPSPDGGFYLIGVKDLCPGLLTDLPWSALNTRAATEERFRRYGFRCSSKLELLRDIDTEEDLSFLYSARNTCGRATQAWLERYPGG